MPSFLKKATLDESQYRMPVGLGGFGSSDPAQAAANIGLLRTIDKDIPGGYLGLDETGKISDPTVIPEEVKTPIPTVNGPLILTALASGVYTITNFDARRTYVINAISGSVSRNGDTITYIAPSTSGEYGFTINEKICTVIVEGQYVLTPSILAPVEAAEELGPKISITSSAFALSSDTDTHSMTTWQVSTDPAFTTITATSINDSQNLTSWTTPDLPSASTLYIRVRYKGVVTNWSSWSAPVSIKTKYSYFPSLEVAKLLSQDISNLSRLGFANDISEDGSTVVVTAPDQETASSAIGAAYIFVLDSGSWIQQAKLTGSDCVVGDNFGSSCSISENGNYVVIGANAKGSGAAYVFTRTGSSWTQQAKLTPSDGQAGDKFGTSISISSDSLYCIIGSPEADHSTFTNPGAAYIFVRSGSSWSQQAKLIASAAANNNDYGYSVDISSNGATVIVGARKHAHSGVTQGGAAYIQTRSGTTWTQQAKLVASDQTSMSNYGHSVSMSSNGLSVAISAPNKANTEGSGAVYLYVRSSGVWSQQAKITPDVPSTSIVKFGSSVKLSSDYTTLAIGCSDESHSALSNAGSVYIYNKFGIVWSFAQKLIVSDKAANDRLSNTESTSLSMNSNGSILVTGAPDKADGSGYIFN